MTAILSALGAPFRAVDRSVQWAVDSVAFALMRLGVTKGRIRYVLWAATALCLVVSLAATWPHSSRHPWDVISMAFLATMFLLNGAREEAAARWAESRQMLSPYDVHGPADTFSKAVFIASGVWQGSLSYAEVAQVCTPAQIEVSRIAMVATNAFPLVLIYLKRTPRVPPTRRQEVHIPAGMATDRA